MLGAGLLRKEQFQVMAMFLVEQTPIDKCSGYSKQNAWIDKV